MRVLPIARVLESSGASFWSTFFVVTLVLMPVIDQVSAVLRGSDEGQMLSISVAYRALLGVTMLFYIAHRSVRGRVPSLRLFVVPSLCFGGWTVLSAVNYWQPITIPHLFRVFYWLAFLCIVSEALSCGDIDRERYTLALGACAVIQLVSLALTPIIGGYGMGIRESTYTAVGAVGGLFFSTKGVSQSLALCVPIVWATVTRPIGRYLVASMMLLGVAVTFSRTALLAVLVALAILSIGPQHSRQSRRAYASLIPLLILGLLIVGVAVAVGPERIAYRWTSANSGGYGSGRAAFWADAFMEWYDGDIFTLFCGKGLAASMEILGRIYGNIWCHNDLLEILLCQGVIGLAFYMWLIGTIGVAIWRYGGRTGQHNAGVAFMASFLVCSVCSGTMYQMDVMTIVCASVGIMATERHSDMGRVLSGPRLPYMPLRLLRGHTASLMSVGRRQA